MYASFKRVIDFLFAFVGLVVLSPAFLVLGVAIKCDSHGPVIFRQKRVGIHGRLFDILKFRTMRVDTPRDMPTHLLDNPVERMTGIGPFLRRSSLDELPQLLNILCGEMSFVGPRPALWNQYDLTAERDKYGANNGRPGLTGWAQVNGRDELPIDIKARLDGDYVRHMGLWFDVRCLLLTVGSVLRSEGVAEGRPQAIESREYETQPTSFVAPETSDVGKRVPQVTDLGTCDE
ncbi:MAG: sugar transferase [Actinomycetota bacterium]|nr:MAG: O-antigen biosynthesis protein [Actinomycetota bacterium]MDO8949075.1 sugar transferase [Actinomycetota bacterium]MDP3630582.1 sugar transferase [Actinomycetota bacterium]